MSTQVLYLMEDHQPIPCYNNKNLIFSSRLSEEDDNNKNEEEGEEQDAQCQDSTYDLDLHPTLKKEIEHQTQRQDRYQKHTVFKENIPAKFESSQPTLATKIHYQQSESYSAIAVRIFRNLAGSILGFVLHILMWFLGHIINICCNEAVHDVLLVIFTVSVEVFVILVFAVSTVLATVIVNIDEACGKRHEVRFRGDVRPEHAEDDTPSITCQILKTRPLRVRKGSPNSSKSDRTSEGEDSDKHVRKQDSKQRKSRDKSKSLRAGDLDNYEDFDEFKLDQNNSFSPIHSSGSQLISKESNSSRSKSPLRDFVTHEAIGEPRVDTNDSHISSKGKNPDEKENELFKKENLFNNLENKEIKSVSFGNNETKLIEKQSFIKENSRNKQSQLKKDKNNSFISTSLGSYGSNEGYEVMGSSEGEISSNTTNESFTSESNESTLESVHSKEECLKSFGFAKRLFENSDGN